MTLRYSGEDFTALVRTNYNSFHDAYLLLFMIEHSEKHVAGVGEADARTIITMRVLQNSDDKGERIVILKFLGVIRVDLKDNFIDSYLTTIYSLTLSFEMANEIHVLIDPPDARCTISCTHIEIIDGDSIHCSGKV